MSLRSRATGLSFRSRATGRSLRSRATGLAVRARAVVERDAPDERAVYRSGVGAIMAQKAARPTFRHLWDAEVPVYSQWGEDGILDYLCDFLDLARPRAVEFGAGNFLECNTRFLAEHRSAAVMAVDARPDLATTIASLRVNWCTTILPRQEWITPLTAPALLKEAQAEFGAVDIVSLDIDGNDYWVADSLPLDEVTIVVVEYNPLFGARYPLSVPRHDNFDRTQAHYSFLYYGASLRAFVTLLARRGLTFLGSNRAGNNAFFVRSSRLAGWPLPVPDPRDLSPYTDWRCRESRDRSGNLDLRTGRERIDIMADLPLVDTVTGEVVPVGAGRAARDQD